MITAIVIRRNILDTLNRACDDAIIIRHDIRETLQQEIPIDTYVDNLGLFDAITKNTLTTDQRLLIDLASLKQSWSRKEFSLHYNVIFHRFS